MKSAIITPELFQQSNGTRWASKTENGALQSRGNSCKDFTAKSNWLRLLLRNENIRENFLKIYLSCTPVVVWIHSQNSEAAAEVSRLTILSHGMILRWSQRLPQSALK